MVERTIRDGHAGSAPSQAANKGVPSVRETPRPAPQAPNNKPSGSSSK